MTTPQQIESFKKGLELGLVVSGWRLEGKSYWYRRSFGGIINQPSDLDIEAMEGLAGRVLREKYYAVHWCCHNRVWKYGDVAGDSFDTLPGKRDDTLTPLVAAVERLRE